MLWDSLPEKILKIYREAAEMGPSFNKGVDWDPIHYKIISSEDFFGDFCEFFEVGYFKENLFLLFSFPSPEKAYQNPKDLRWSFYENSSW